MTEGGGRPMQASGAMLGGYGGFTVVAAGPGVKVTGKGGVGVGIGTGTHAGAGGSGSGFGGRGSGHSYVGLGGGGGTTSASGPWVPPELVCPSSNARRQLEHRQIHAAL